MKTKGSRAGELEKMLTGIDGLDQLTAGGFPRGCTIQLLGGQGCGKTVLALHALIENKNAVRAKRQRKRLEIEQRPARSN